VRKNETSEKAHKSNEDCKHSVDYGESVLWINCELKHKKRYVEKTDTCNKWEGEEKDEDG
jgi:hypothetical protein